MNSKTLRSLRLNIFSGTFFTAKGARFRRLEALIGLNTCNSIEIDLERLRYFFVCNPLILRYVFVMIPL